jgi:ribosomal protein S12 methylthiotransferase
MKQSASKAAPKVGIVSLGCPKALVDSERILTKLRSEGYVVSDTYDGADVVIVNTCGFLNSAKQESLDAIGEALKENGKVIVTGCMGGNEQAIRSVHPGVLSVTGPQQYESVVSAVHKAVPPKHDPFVDLVPPQGLRLTPRHYAYLKISEGCNNRCTFCIIPSLRGDLVSRPAREVLVEAENLAKAGVKELLVISQDTSAYGVDIKYAESLWRGDMVKARMTELCQALSQLGIWVRLHYVYPYPHVDEVIPLMAEGRLLPYLDVPFQHASPRILRLMKRPASAEKVLRRLEAWRRICPDITVRSTFIVGFPGETDAEFSELIGFLEEAELDRVGCFEYSPVEGAAANALPGPVADDVKRQRRAEFMEVQERISARKLQRKVGKALKVLVDEPGIGRSSADAPEIDGVVRFKGGKAGEFREILIDRADAHDLHGRLL